MVGDGLVMELARRREAEGGRWGWVQMSLLGLG